MRYVRRLHDTVMSLLLILLLLTILLKHKGTNKADMLCGTYIKNQHMNVAFLIVLDMTALNVHHQVAPINVSS